MFHLPIQERERERGNQPSLYSSVRLSRAFSVLATLLTLFLLFSFSVIPYEYCHAVGSPTFWDSRVYPMGLVDEGSGEAGQKNSEAEYAFLPTSHWTTLSANLQTGNFMVLAPLVTIQRRTESLIRFFDL